MGKVEDNKKLKMNTLLQTAFDLFSVYYYNRFDILFGGDGSC